MKVTVIVLVILGVLAAIFAAILIGTLPNRFGTGPDAATEVAVMKRALPAMAQITEADITKDVGSRDKLPAGCLSLKQVVGRILAVPVVAGQPLTQSCLVPEGGSAQLAASLAPGKRAVSVTLPRLAVKGGMLYPGCVVDVLASFRILSADRREGQAVSATLLDNIQVLAVGDTSVVTKSDPTKAAQDRANENQITVTLAVDPKQAEAIQLATGYGSIFLALRNPLDKDRNDRDATILNESSIAKFGSAMTLPVSFADSLTDREVALAEPNNSPNTLSTAPADISGLLTGKVRGNPQWGVTVIRGRDVQDEKMTMPEDYAASGRISQ